MGGGMGGIDPEILFSMMNGGAGFGGDPGFGGARFSSGGRRPGGFPSGFQFG